MPRYLAVDYFAVAQQDARAALNRLLLSVPAHLEQVEAYVHQGIAPSTLYRTPWIKSTALTNEDLRMEEEIASLTDRMERDDKLEKYESDAVFYANAQCEIVPSSNPYSQESIDEDVLFKLGALNSEDGGSEYFEKHFESCTQEDMFLEELCGSDIHSQDASAPSISKLLSRLKPMVMTDPLADENGKPLQEEKFLAASRKLEAEEEYVTLCEENFDQPELVLKEKQVFEEEPDQFMEIMSKETKSPEVPTTGVGELITNAKEEELGTVLKDDIALLMAKTTPDQSVEPLSRIKDLETCDETLDFLEINDASSQFKETESVLESPMLHVKIISEDRMMKPWTNESISTAIEEKCDPDILSPTSKDRVEKELWTQGKYFDDILALRLKEPDCPPLVVTSVTPDAVMKSLDVKPTLFDTKDLDLELQWDPFSEKLSSRKVEPLKEETEKAEEQPNNTVISEPVEKYAVDVCRPDVEQRKITRSALLPTLYHPMEIRGVRYGTERTPLKDSSHSNEARHTQKPKVPAQTPQKMVHSPISVCTPAKFDDIQIFMSSRRSAKKRETSRFSKAKVVERPDANKASASESVPTKQSSSLSMVKELNKETKQDESVYTVPLSSPPRSPPVTGACDQMDCTIAPSTPSTPTVSKRSAATRKCSVVTIPLDDIHQDLLFRLEQLSRKYTHHLAVRRLLPSTQEFCSLTPDVTRFILKQHERKRQDMVRSLPAGSDGDYTAVIMLHALVCCADTVTHCCVQSAVAQLQCMKDKYVGHGVFTDAEEVFSHVYQQHEGKASHPAMTKLCEHLSHWLVKKKIKSPGHDPKILIMMKQAVSGLCEAITSVVSTVVSVEMFKPGDKQPSPQEICAQLDNHTCLVIPATLINPAFPWSQFSMVVHYDYREGQDKWKDICNRQNIRFLGIRIQAPEKPSSHKDLSPTTIVRSSAFRSSSGITQQSSKVVHGGNNSPRVPGDTQARSRGLIDCARSPRTIYEPHTVSARDVSKLSSTTPGKINNKRHEMTPYTLISSDCVVEQSALLQELESKYQIFIRARSFPSPCAPDICINSDCGIMLVSLSSGPASDLVNRTMTRLGRLLLGFSMVWVVLHGDLTSAVPTSSSYVFSGDAVAIVVKIQAAVANMSGMVGKSQAKVMLASTAGATASMIRQIADYSKPSVSADIQEASQHEMFLQRLPCLNAVNIHRMLQAVPLATLMTMSAQQLQDCFPGIPHEQLEVLWNITNVNQGIHVGLDHRDAADFIQTPVHGTAPKQTSRQDRAEFSVQYSPVVSYDTSPARGCDLPDLALSQPNEFAKAEMQGRLMNSFIEEGGDIESVYCEPPTREPYEQYSLRNIDPVGNYPVEHARRWNETRQQQQQRTRAKPSQQWNETQQQVRSGEKRSDWLLPVSPICVTPEANRYQQQARGSMMHEQAYQYRQSQPYNQSANIPDPCARSSTDMRLSSARSNMLSPETSGALCIAPVTPTVRVQQPVTLLGTSPPMDLSSDESEPEQKPSIARKLAEMSARGKYGASKREEQSYGRELSREYDELPGRGYKEHSNRNVYASGRIPDEQPTQHLHSSHRLYSDHQSAQQSCRVPNMYDEPQDRMHQGEYSQGRNSDREYARNSAGCSAKYNPGLLTPSRKRKLTYLPVPGLKSGQTKLAFL